MSSDAQRIWEDVSSSLGSGLLEVMRQGWSVHVFPAESGNGWAGALRREGCTTITATSARPEACVFFLFEMWLTRGCAKCGVQLTQHFGGRPCE